MKPMNTSLLQRLSFLAVLPLCTLIVMAAARAAEPPATPEPPGTAASAPAAEASDWQDALAGHDHRSRHRHREHGNDVVNIGSDSNLASGQKADSVVSIFGSSTSDGEAGDVVSIFGDTRVTGEVHDNAVAVFGNTYIDGKIDGDAVSVLGNMQLGPHAEIGGDVSAVGGTVQRDPAAIVHGNVQNVISTDFGGTGPIRTWIRHCLLYGRPLSLAPGLGWAWGLALTFLALYAALALLSWVGRRIAGRHDAGRLSHPAVTVLIGGALVLVLYLVPVLGFLVYKLLGVLGLGAVV